MGKMCHLINSSSTWGLNVLCLVFFLTIRGVRGSQSCAPGLDIIGRTWPQGDIQLEYGEPLKIYCILDETLRESRYPGKSSLDLVFFRNGRQIEPEHVTLINETTIAMYIEKPEPSSDVYICKLRLNNGYGQQYEDICMNKVIIGFKPKEPLNFSCVSQNWENLTCTWVPAPNHIATKFSLGYKIPGRIGGRTTFKCPEPKSDQKLPPNTCMWDTSTDPSYRVFHENFKFMLTAENFLGTKVFIYPIHHFAHVIPAKPVGLSVVNKTSSSVLLHWKVPYPMGVFPPGLHHKVSYQSEWDDPKKWETKYITTKVRENVKYFNLSDLPYANAAYKVRVFGKSSLAVGEGKWSESSNLNFRTAATLPGQSPKTAMGSFETVVKRSSRDVYIYWQAIPAYFENGDNFTYEVFGMKEDGKLSYLKPDEITKSYALFKELSLNSNFKFEIVAINCVGVNERKATIHVPSENRRPKEPTSITKTTFDGRLFELSWDAPSSTDIVNQTIFWCENMWDRPYQCSGYLDWITVTPNMRVYNITVPDETKLYQFAVAANTDQGSSGMAWTTCTVIHNSVVGKMDSVWVNNVESRLIEVGWKLKCSDRTNSVNGFVVYYCPMESPKYHNCKGSKLSKIVPGDRNTIHGIVDGLKPYTTYMLSVAVLTNNGEGPDSDPIFATTIETAPSSPENVIATVTGTAITVEWKPPSDVNGVLRYYTVHYDQEPKDHNQQIETEERTVIRDLEPDTVYNVRVSACTVMCGKRSSQILVRTETAIKHGSNAPRPKSDVADEDEENPNQSRHLSTSAIPAVLDDRKCLSIQRQVTKSQQQAKLAQEEAARAIDIFFESCVRPVGLDFGR
ncbi:cytokine receptor-like [Neodiprion pinetum]|uniref:cytokine receptor-like n=1 Tax=Neodiprion pinetum TaxID=441929 RepID=UPI001EDDC402|nr:cytokine receptor-like [Neodiprion pinetum]XP_046481318.1 cytokine receptor-like [Neodiprion pinetum]